MGSGMVGIRIFAATASVVVGVGFLFASLAPGMRWDTNLLIGFLLITNGAIHICGVEE